MTEEEERAVGEVELKIRKLFDLINLHEFKQYYELIDPKARETLTLEQTTENAKRFIEQVGKVEFVKTVLTPHIGEKSNLYDDKDFVVGVSTCVIKGKEITIREVWIRRYSAKRNWYSKRTGFIWAD